MRFVLKSSNTGYQTQKPLRRYEVFDGGVKLGEVFQKEATTIRRNRRRRRIAGGSVSICWDYWLLGKLSRSSAYNTRKRAVEALQQEIRYREERNREPST